MRSSSVGISHLACDESDRNGVVGEFMQRLRRLKVRMEENRNFGGLTTNEAGYWIFSWFLIEKLLLNLFDLLQWARAYSGLILEGAK